MPSYKARGTLDSGENFSFNVTSDNFVFAANLASQTMQNRLGNRAGAVESFAMKLLADDDGGFKIRKSEATGRRKGKAAQAGAPVVPAALAGGKR